MLGSRLAARRQSPASVRKGALDRVSDFGGLGRDRVAQPAQLSAQLVDLVEQPENERHRLVASAHVYDFAEGSGIDAMFKSQLEPIAKQLPVILGERYCGSATASYTRHVLSLVNGEADERSLFGVLGWTPRRHGCSRPLQLGPVKSRQPTRTRWHSLA